MGLTSGYFISLMIAVAVASLAGTVWLWPRAAASLIGSLAGRLGLIAVSQMLVIAAFLACLNSYLSLFDSWSDLFGKGTPQPLPAAASAESSSPIVITKSGQGPALAGAAQPASANGAAGNNSPQGHAGHAPAVVGKLLQVVIRGERTGISVATDYVYLPPEYFQRAYARSRFPVVLALTGYPGSAFSIVKRLGLPATAARLVAAGQIGPAIYVMMNVSVAMPRDTECANVPAGPQVASFFAEDVQQAIEQTFRAQTSRSGWAALGYSTGGYCAAKLAMMYPYRFSSAVSIAGYYTAFQDHTTGNLYGGSLAYRRENNLDWRLRDLPDPPVSVLVSSSRVGEKNYQGTMNFLKMIHPPMRGYSLILPEGGHNFRTWYRELGPSLTWLGRQLSPARPAARPVASRS